MTLGPYGMGVEIRRGTFGMSQCMAFFLVIIFISAAASESGWSETFEERRLDLAHWQPTDEQDCQTCSASLVHAIERRDLQLRLSAYILGTQNKSVKSIQTTIASQSNRTNLTNSIEPLPAFRNNFNEGHLDHERWNVIQEGEFRESIVDVITVDPMKQNEYRLRLGMDTIGTRDETVKYIGVRSADRLSLHPPAEISFDLDWNNQSNGCYLTVAVYLCPTVTNANPEREGDWLRFEYVGVPPGQNARAVIAIKNNGTVQHLFTEGWPEKRVGRHIGVQRIKMILDTNEFTILENGAPLYHVDSRNLKFDSIYLYLIMSSHSNYPFREIYFDNISVMEK